MAALDRDFLHGIGHVLDGDGEEAFGNLLRRATGLYGEQGEFFADDLRVQRLVAMRAEYGREQVRLQFAEHDIGVGDG